MLGGDDDIGEIMLAIEVIGVFAQNQFNEYGLAGSAERFDERAQGIGVIPVAVLQREFAV